MSATTTTAVLKVAGLEVSYGAVRAVRGVDLELTEGAICVLLGANGAGKSSVIRSLIGLVKPTAGQIELPAGAPVVGLPPHRLNEMGVAWVPEGRQVFAELTVEENLIIGGFRLRKQRSRGEAIERIVEMFPRLGERLQQPAGLLSGGEQQMLALGRALMSEPRVLLLDEPSLGLAPMIVESLFDRIALIRDDGVSILMAEQNASQALRVADYGYVLENGSVRGEGTAAELEAREDVQAAYLGG